MVPLLRFVVQFRRETDRRVTGESRRRRLDIGSPVSHRNVESESRFETTGPSGQASDKGRKGLLFRPSSAMQAWRAVGTRITRISNATATVGIGPSSHLTEMVW